MSQNVAVLASAIYGIAESVVMPVFPPSLTPRLALPIDATKLSGWRRSVAAALSYRVLGFLGRRRQSATLEVCVSRRQYTEPHLRHILSPFFLGDHWSNILKFFAFSKVH